MAALDERALPRRAGIYCRLSYAPDGSVEKVERQEGDCMELGARLRWPISGAHVFIDNSRSAWQRNRKRPAWDRMLAAIEAGEIDAIVVYHGDRLIRQPFDLEKLIGIADQRGIRIASVSGTRDLDSPDDRFILRIEAAQACRESDNTSRRVMRGVKARVAKGRPRPGGRRPFGWGVPTGATRLKIDRTSGEAVEVPVLDYDQVVPHEAELLAEVAERLLAGLSEYGAVRWMNERSTTSCGNPWQPKTLRAALLAPRMAGLIEYNGDLYEAVWDPVISVETWQDVKSLFDQKRETHGYHGRERKHLLSGVAECSDCHAAATDVSATCDDGFADCKHPHARVSTKPVGRKGAPRSQIYYCRACGRGRNESHLNAYVEGRVLRLLQDRRLLKELQSTAETGKSIGAEIAALQRRRDETKAKLQNLADHGDLDPVILATSLASFDRKITDLRLQMAVGSQAKLLARMFGITREEWADEPIDVRAATVKALYRVVIKPTKKGPGFAPDSVELIRRPLSTT